jgi:hypothetical protein
MNWPASIERRRFLLELLPHASVGIEIGVHLGDFAEAILIVVEPTELHLVDPWYYESSPRYDKAWYGGKGADGQRELDARHAAVCERFAVQIRAGQVAVHRGQSETILPQFPDGYFDWVYIDGNHLYEYVARDLALALEKTRPAGLITGDDYTDSGWWGGGVKRAVDQFVANPAVDFIEVRNGQYVFAKR